ncbi:MAG: DUF393 domain-containing protein [Desulfuromonas sp.]|nr:MAG: DUF393 domain-containing protein [Desulfuromonas sp.]
MATMENEKIKIFYDASCRVCDAEISHYMKIEDGVDLEYVNINDPGFDPAAYGKNLDEFMEQLHVQDRDGTFHVGVDAFRLIWRQLPGAHYHLLAIMTGLPGINLFSRIGYRMFAANRHRLPKKPD